MSGEDELGEAGPSWFVDAQRGDFKIGAEVTISIGECHHHGEQEAGVRGVVVGIDENAKFTPHPTHRYLVYFRRPLPLTRSLLRSWYYMGSELVPFDPPEALERRPATRPPEDGGRRDG